MRLLLTVLAALSFVSCQSQGTHSIASRYPRFARDCIRKVEQARSFSNPNGEVTTFVRATPRGTPFVAVCRPEASLNQMSGGQVQNSGHEKNSFSAHSISSLYITTKDYTVDLDSLYHFPSLFSYHITVEDDGVITIDPNLFKVVFQRQNGVWKNTAVQCQFPRQDVSEKDLRAETAALEKTGWGDKVFPPGHGEREQRYRIMLLNYVSAKHVKFSHNEVYKSEETSTTSYLAGLLYELIEKGVPVTFEP